MKYIPEVGDYVKILPGLSKASHLYNGKIGQITKCDLKNGFVRIDLEDDNFSGGLWLNEIEQIMDFEYEWI